MGFAYILAAVVVLLIFGGGAALWWARQTAMVRAEREVAMVEMEAARAHAEARVAEVESMRAAERERQGRNAASIEEHLARVEEALRAEDLSKAALSLKEAETRAEEGGAAALAPRLTRSRADLEMLRNLDQIDNLRWTPIDGRLPDPAELATRLAAAFDSFGVKPEASPEDAARRITESAIRNRLIAALDCWLVWSQSPAVRDILRAADPDPFRNALREAIQSQNAGRVQEQAARPEALDQPIWFIAALGECPSIPRARRAELLQAALRRSPSDFSVLMVLGQFYAAGGDGAEERIRWYQAALAVQPTNVAVLNNLGVALLQKDDIVGAVAAFREAIRLDPKDAKAHLHLGNAIAARCAAEDGAIACFREAIRLDPKNARAHVALGRSLLAKGDVITARETFREAIRLDPTDAKAHRHLGEALLHMGDLDGAVAAFRQAIRLDPKDAASHAGLGKTINVKGDPEGALAAYREAIRLDPKRYESLLKPTAEVAPSPRPKP